MWDYTPREVAGWLWYAQRRRKREMLELTIASFDGARGDPKAIKKQIKDLARD